MRERRDQKGHGHSALSQQTGGYRPFRWSRETSTIRNVSLGLVCYLLGFAAQLVGGGSVRLGYEMDMCWRRALFESTGGAAGSKPALRVLVPVLAEYDGGGVRGVGRVVQFRCAGLSMFIQGARGNRQPPREPGSYGLRLRGFPRAPWNWGMKLSRIAIR